MSALAEAQARIIRTRQTGDDRGLVRLLGYSGDALRVLCHLRLARVVLAEALLLSRRLGDASSEVATMIRLAEVHRFADRCERAERLLRGVLRQSASEPASRYRDFALQHLGKTLLDAGRPDEAISCFEEALRLRQRKGDPALVDSTEAALRAAQMSAAGPTGAPRSLFERWAPGAERSAEGWTDASASPISDQVSSPDPG